VAAVLAWALAIVVWIAGMLAVQQVDLEDSSIGMRKE